MVLEVMAPHNIKTICFFTRRYDDILDNKIFKQKFHSQYFWVKYLDSSQYRIMWIFGSSNDHKMDHSLGQIHFLKDYKRTNPIIQKFSFYKKSAELVEKEKVDVVICNGINDIFSHYLLARRIDSIAYTIVQDHATMFKTKYTFVSTFFKRINSYIFNSEGLEKEWVKSNLIAKENIFYLPEGVSEFKANDKNIARQLTKMKGDPIFLWVGNLVKLKDPMSCLEAISGLVKEKKDLRLYMIYQKAPLKSIVNNFIQKNNLENNIILLGSIKHKDIEPYFQSADYYISSSLKEGSGYAAIEAMACNVIPILSNIPSFKHFTKDGEVGGMFEQEKPQDIKKKVLELLAKDTESAKLKLEIYYHANFSPEALAQKFSSCIQTILHAK